MTRPLAVAVLLVGTLAADCSRAPRDPPRPTVTPPREAAGDPSEIRDTMDLLRAIEAEVFADADAPPERPAAPEVVERAVIRFHAGTSIPDDEMPKLEALARTAAARASARIDLVGCSDPSGPEAVNVRISRARAAAVASILGSLGVPEERIGEVVGRGEDCEVQERVVHVTVRRAQETARVAP